MDYKLNITAPEKLFESDNAESFNLEGIAYSGDAVTYFGSEMIIDLSAVNLKTPLPVFYQHNPSHRLAVITEYSTEGDKLAIKGNRLSNGEAEKVWADAKEGFPFQMSIWLDGDALPFKETVNGRKTHKGMTILGGAIREISITPLGVDSNTSAVMMAANQSQDGGNTGMDPTKLAELEATNTALATENASLKAALSELNKQMAWASRSAKLSALFELTEQDQKIYGSMTDEQFAGVMARLSTIKPAAGTQELATDQQPEQQDGGTDVSKMSVLQRLALLSDNQQGV